MALLINHAILHILDNTVAGSRYSRQELDTDSEICHDFLQKHVRRLMSNPAAREADFKADSEMHGLVGAYGRGDIRFGEFALRACRRLDDIMQRSRDIPPADVVVADVEDRRGRYLAIIKLNYAECFTHKVVEDGDGAENQIVKHTAVLPAAGGKVEEACLIPFDPMVLRILEKPCPVDGQEVNYFSELFLECETVLSSKEAAEIIRGIAGEINAKYFDESIETAARLDCAFIDEAEETSGEEGFTVDNVVRRAFPDNEAARTEFVAMAKEAGLPHEVRMGKPFVRQQFKTQRFKADNGIEIKCPSQLFDDPETVRIDANSDGTVTITLRGLRRAEA